MNNKKSILVTGGSGYIGSHTCVELLNSGHDIAVVDNLSNSVEESLKRVEKITGKKIVFYQADIRDRQALKEIFSAHDFNAVIHFAGLKAVGESVANPLQYYENNVNGTIVLCETMAAAGVKKIIFSSSATVYGDPESVPITEDFPLNQTNPYGRTKLFIEEILKDLAIADPEWKVTLLRYFNPIGAHESGLIGEDPNGIPNNLLPFISQVAVGKLEKLMVFGDDYETTDGTGVRDYIHVVDLARGHLAALDAPDRGGPVSIYNLGTGRGYSVLEVIAAFERNSGKKVPFSIVDRRPGDIARCYADPSKAEKELGWKAHFGIDDMCRDSWKWQEINPEGYSKSKRKNW